MRTGTHVIWKIQKITVLSSNWSWMFDSNIRLEMCRQYSNIAHSMDTAELWDGYSWIYFKKLIILYI